MNELIPVQTNEDGEQLISGRDLHMFLEVETPYTMWIDRMIKYGFYESRDFITKMLKSTGGRPSADHMLTIDMAKQLCMIARSDKGRQAREYFLQVERLWNSPEAILNRALEYSRRQIEQQRAQLLEQAPKVIFADAVNASHTSILIGDLAKLLKQNGVETGQKRLFEFMRSNGYLIKTGNSKNMPTQRAMEMELFEVKESTVNNPDGSIRVTRTTKVTGKGQIYFINLFLKNQEMEVIT